jgi:hypothetical protein
MKKREGATDIAKTTRSSRYLRGVEQLDGVVLQQTAFAHLSNDWAGAHHEASPSMSGACLFPGLPASGLTHFIAVLGLFRTVAFDIDLSFLFFWGFSYLHAIDVGSSVPPPC